MVRTLPFRGRDIGSNPVKSKKNKKNILKNKKNFNEIKI